MLVDVHPKVTRQAASENLQMTNVVTLNIKVLNNFV